MIYYFFHFMSHQNSEMLLCLLIFYLGWIHWPHLLISWQGFLYFLPNVCHFSKWSSLKTLHNFEKSSKMAKNWHKINEEKLFQKFTDESSVKYLQIGKWGRWIGEFNLSFQDCLAFIAMLMLVYATLLLNLATDLPPFRPQMKISMN